MKNRSIFFAIQILVLVVALLLDLLLTKDLYYKSLSDQMSIEMISKLLDIKQKIGWLSFIISPTMISIKMVLIAGILYIGSTFSGFDKNFGDFWRIVLIAEFVSIVYLFIRTGLLYSNNFQDVNDIQSYLPFTVYHIINKETISQYFYYPLSLLNLFELFYWLVLAYLLKPLLKLNFIKSIGFIAKTYGIGLIIWASFIVYFSINIST